MRRTRTVRIIAAVMREAPYVELHCHSALSLLDGASLPDALALRAAKLGYDALAITDHDEMGGVVRFGTACVEAGIDGILGAELTVAVPDALHADGERRTHLTVLAETREGYSNIAALVTRARMDCPRGTPAVTLELLAKHARGVTALTGCPRGWVPQLLADGRNDDAWNAACTLRDIYNGSLAVECWDHGLPEERALVRALRPLSHKLGVPWVVTNNVHYAAPEGRMIHDVLCALRHQRTLDEMGTRLRPNGEWYLKSPATVLKQWTGAEEGVRATRVIAERCAFRLGQLKPSMPVFALPPGVTADEYLVELIEGGANERWGASRTAQHDAQLAHELTMIRKLNLAGYFLTVWDIVQFARRERILCQGRGSAANSAVCYVLGITAVDPIRMNLLFERFLSEDRQEAPDIDIDFAHRDRERVLQYVYTKYGREHAAMVCEQITWRGKSAVRDAARVLGFSPEQGDMLSTLSDRFSAKSTADALRVTDESAAVPQGIGDRHAKATHAERRNPTTAIREALTGRALLQRAGLDPDDHRVRMLADIVEGLHELPRHRSIHTGGFILTEEPLGNVVPIEPASMADRTVIQWEKDDLDAPGLIKIDLLGLGMLTVVQDCMIYVRNTRGVQIDLGALPMDDPAVYDMLCAADTVGLFQVESRAQMNTLPRLKPRCYYDLVVQVSLIRPGPIQGEMVHPYLRRRDGLEPVTYVHPSVENALKRTLGIPLFQEQGMQVAIAAAGFTATQADVLRRAMGHKRSRDRMAAICEDLVAGMKANGIEETTARRIYQQINAFADYGFPESHAASFALIVYATAHLRHYYPAEYTAAILNAQPMGFYAPGTLIEDAKRHGVEVRAIDLMRSAWDHTLEMDDGRVLIPHNGAVAWEARAPSRDAGRAIVAVRLGVRLVKGLGGHARAALEAALLDGPFTSVENAIERVPLDRRSWRKLAEAGAFDSMFAHEPEQRRRRVALWEVLAATHRTQLPLALSRVTPPPASLPALTPIELTEADYRMTGLSLAGHPMHHMRAILAPNGVTSARDIADRGRDGQPIAVAGLVICRQRPGTAKGFVFLTLEDETGLINIVIKPDVFDKDALLISTSPLLLVRGTLQVEGRVMNVRAKQFRKLELGGGEAMVRGRNFH